MVDDVEGQVGTQVEASPDGRLRPVEIHAHAQDDDVVAARAARLRRSGRASPSDGSDGERVEDSADADLRDERLQLGPDVVLVRGHLSTVPGALDGSPRGSRVADSWRADWSQEGAVARQNGLHLQRLR
ncbi:hypothetical protein [Xylanimonas cellulosilytica]|uniref:hypothetical protein n=1 Tax=Xylanimonas cellulosilytica TaxID=186189 RepID=UPI0005A22D3C|nr:hypothetical protein [Xylanimonas cellulosilytica]